MPQFDFRDKETQIDPLDPLLYDFDKEVSKFAKHWISSKASLYYNKLGLSWGSTRLRQLAWSLPTKSNINKIFR